MLDEVVTIATAKGVTPSHLALAWVPAQGGDIVPILGTRRVAYLAENVGAVEITLTTDRTRGDPEGCSAGCGAGGALLAGVDGQRRPSIGALGTEGSGPQEPP